MSTIKVTNIEHESTGNGGIQLDNAGHVTVDGQQMPTAGPLSNRNLIINGAMVHDQRNNGSAVTLNSDGFAGRQFPVDRFHVQRSGAVVVSCEQDTETPAGFKNSIKLTVSTADNSVAAGDYLFAGYRFEGNDVAHLGFGTSNAVKFTLSFWVRSSLTGTYTVFFGNYADNRTHRKEYTISAANTWEYKTITLTADTTGTWNTNNSGGLNIGWTLLAGSDYVNTAGTWTGTVDTATSNQTQWGSTGSATFYLTGVQLELGEKATPFEHKSYSDELARCQRYYRQNARILGIWTNNQYMRFIHLLSPYMRAAPTVTLLDTNGYHEKWNSLGFTGISSVGGVYGNNTSQDFVLQSNQTRNATYNDTAMLGPDVVSFSAEL